MYLSINYQVEFSQGLRYQGVGLSDGEVMERMWSFLRRFSRMTKEMRPSHRIDVLTHALLYYASQKTDKLGKEYFDVYHYHYAIVHASS